MKAPTRVVARSLLQPHLAFSLIVGSSPLRTLPRETDGTSSLMMQNMCTTSGITVTPRALTAICALDFVAMQVGPMHSQAQRHITLRQQELLRCQGVITRLGGMTRSTKRCGSQRSIRVEFPESLTAVLVLLASPLRISPQQQNGVAGLSVQVDSFLLVLAPIS